MDNLVPTSAAEGDELDAGPDVVDNQRLDEPVAEMDADIRDLSLSALGRRIRHLRQERRMTLQELAEATGLSSSMISLVERGRTSPSIGSLVVIASAFRVPIGDLFLEIDQTTEDPVVRESEQTVVAPWPGVSRRTAKFDRLRGVEISVNEWEPGQQPEPQPAHHAGYEYGLLLDGELTVDVSGATFVLCPGDLICYPSTELHRLRNEGENVARAVWFNLGSL
jgi:transcriptional regulator with XRE-family HTH domain